MRHKGWQKSENNFLRKTGKNINPKLWLLLMVICATTKAFGQPQHLIYGQDFQPKKNGGFEKVSLAANYYPGRNDQNYPLIVIIHGGHFLKPGDNELSWGSYEDSCVIYLAEELQKVGLHVVVPQLRSGLENQLSAKEAYIRAWYRASQDIHTLVRYINSPAGKINLKGVDSTEIVLWGFESGGLVAAACANATRNQEWLSNELLKPDSSGPIIDFKALGNPLGTTHGISGADTTHIAQHIAFPSHVAMWVAAGGAILNSSWIRFISPVSLLFHTPVDPIIPFGTGKIIMPKGYVTITEVLGSKKIQEAYKALAKYDLWERANFSDQTTLIAKKRNGGQEGLFIFSPEFSTDHTPWNWADSSTWIAIPHPTCAPLSPPICSYYLNALFNNPDMSGVKGRAYIDTMLSYFKPRIDVLFGTTTSVETDAKHDPPLALKVYPNPVYYDQLWIEIPESTYLGINNLNVLLYDQLGRAVLNEKIKRTPILSLQIPKELNSGIYYIHLSNGFQQLTKRIFINH